MVVRHIGMKNALPACKDYMRKERKEAIGKKWLGVFAARLEFCNQGANQPPSFIADNYQFGLPWSTSHLLNTNTDTRPSSLELSPTRNVAEQQVGKE